MFADPIEILRQYWGYSSFRPQQEDIIRSVMLGNDTLAMMPTGGGKSLCFQVPALCMPGICVVVSPLVALMKDQVERLHRMDIKAHLVTSALTKKETDYILDNCVQGPIKFLYVSPERLQNELFIERFKRMKVNIIAVDEAHCISQWGHDFRPAYRKISELRQFHPKVNVIAVTASATPEVADDILSQLAMRDPAVFSLPMKRSNLHYAVVEESDTMARLVRVCRKNQGTGIVYAGTRRGVKAAAEYLNAHGIDAKYYHAGLTTSEKEIVQQQWMSGKTRVICATNAFGMGIDKADVRFVVHTQLPDNLENYVQEAGRGGRDGKDAWAILLWNNSQRTDYQENLKRRFPPKERVRETYLHLCNFFDLAYGSGLDVSVSFDVSDFAKRYKRTLSEVYFELEILELAGVISLSEGALLPTRVMFKMQANVLYDFQVRNPKFDAFIRLLLRSYGGLFEGFAKIDVYALAKNTGWTVQQVEQTLRQLENFEVLYYQPAATHPTLTFLIARQEHTNLIIPSVAYESRKERMESRFDAVQHYLTASCREQFIAHYFGDTEASTCGHCDVCVDKKKQHSSLQDDLLAMLADGQYALADIADHYSGKRQEEALQLLGHLMEEGLIERNEDGMLILVKGAH